MIRHVYKANSNTAKDSVCDKNPDTNELEEINHNNLQPRDNVLTRGVIYEEEKPLIRGIEYETIEEKKPPKPNVEEVNLNDEPPKESTSLNNEKNDDTKYYRPIDYKEDSNFANMLNIEVKRISELFKTNAFKEKYSEATSTEKTNKSQLGFTMNGIPAIELAKTLNFEVFLKSKEIEIHDQESGEVAVYFYNMVIVVTTMKGTLCNYEAKVSAEKVKDFFWVQQATHSLATRPVEKEEKLEFQAMIQRAIETENVPETVSYTTPGWRYIQALSGMRYVYADGVIGESTNNIYVRDRKYRLMINADALHKVETFNCAMQMGMICKNRLTSTALLVFVHTSVLTTVFEEAGYPVNFLFGISGVTNSRKTSLALAMAQIFHREKFLADAEFTSATPAGIEKTLSLYKDGCVIIDDYKPGITRSQQHAMNEKFENLIRLYGNRVPKARMRRPDLSVDRDYYPVDGCCIVTMEIVPEGLSSLSRCFITEIGIDDVDNSLLGFYRENRWVLPTHLYAFIEWITYNYNGIRDYIVRAMKYYRANVSFEFPRYNEMYATFLVTANIIADYAISVGFWSEEEKMQFVNLVAQIVTNELNRMGNRSTLKDKGYIAIQALTEALLKEKIAIYELTELSARERRDCYHDSEYIYIRAKTFKVLANEYAAAYQETCRIGSEEELTGLLERLKVIKVHDYNGEKKRTRKLPAPKGNTYNYVYISIKQLKKIINS